MMARAVARRLATSDASPPAGLRARRRRARAGDPAGLRLAIVVACLALIAVLASRVAAEPLDTIVRAQLAPALPAGLGVARLYLPAALARLDLDPAKVSVELPRALTGGRPSVRLAIRGRAAVWVPVQLAPIIDVAIAQRAIAAGEPIDEADVAIEPRATPDPAPASAATIVGATARAAISVGAVIAARDVALAPPLPRGAPVAIEARHGAVRVHTTGILELAARPGEPATARLPATHGVVHGRLRAPATLILGDLP